MFDFICSIADEQRKTELRREEQRCIDELKAEAEKWWAEMETIEAIEKRTASLYKHALAEWRRASEELRRQELGQAFLPPTAPVQ